MRLVSQREFPISTTMTGALMRIKPGGLRELHWHPNADEWQYYIGGSAAHDRVRLARPRLRTEDFDAGDVGYVPQGFGHYIENIGDTNCRLLLAFNSGTYQEIGLSGWIASNPRQLLATNLGVSEDLLKGLPERDVYRQIALCARPRMLALHSALAMFRVEFRRQVDQRLADLHRIIGVPIEQSATLQATAATDRRRAGESRRVMARAPHVARRA